MLQYTPDADLRLHNEGAIRLICAPFQSHEHGLPEWIKNSSDEYVRLNAAEQHRVIVVHFDGGGRSRSPSISVLDFNGMSTDVIEKKFRVWADPEAARRAYSTAPVQGGHGNGGKCYMTMLFDEYAHIHSVKDGHGNRYGVASGTFRFGYIPDPDAGRSFDVDDVQAELDKALNSIGMRFEQLPSVAKSVALARRGFTLVSGHRPRNFDVRRDAPRLVKQIADHPQMALTLQLCKVFVLLNGRPLADAHPMTLDPIPPDPGFAEPRVVAVPEVLVDPESGNEVSTTSDGSLEPGTLVLRTSEKRMTSARDRRLRHAVIYRSKSGVIGYRRVPEFDVQSSFRDRLYGECTLDALDGAKQNNRGPLAESPLVRGVEAFISGELRKLAAEFEARERRHYGQKEKDELSRINEALDAWKNRFMATYVAGLWGGTGEAGISERHNHLQLGQPVRLEATVAFGYAGIGVTFKPKVHFFDKAGTRIRPVPYRWVCDDTSVAFVDEDLNVVQTLDAGETKVYAETLDGKLQSNSVPLSVRRIRSVTLTPQEIELPVGSWRKIQAICRQSSGDALEDVALIWMTGNPETAQVSADGRVFGHNIGSTEVTAGDDRSMADEPVSVRVTEAASGGSEGNGGRGFPRVLVSSVDADPRTNEQVDLAVDDPPVMQRPQDVDLHIWWINSSAPMARMYLDATRGYGYNSREWRIYHLERYIEIMVQIALTTDPDAVDLDVNSWLIKWGEQASAIQAAAAEALETFISDGELPS